MATEFLIEDRSIEGDIIRRTRSSYTQASPAEFLAAIDSILAVPGVAAVGWNQYTPYFNDGEPCEFSIGSVAVRLDPEYFNLSDEDVEEFEDDEAWGFPDDGAWATDYGLFSYIDKNLSYSSGLYDDANRRFEINGVSTLPIKEALKVWNAGAFESVALENFGDHALVVATKDGFDVEFFEHE